MDSRNFRFGVMSVCWDAVPGEGTEALHLTLPPCPTHLFHLAALELYPLFIYFLLLRSIF